MSGPRGWLSAGGVISIKLVKEFLQADPGITWKFGEGGEELGAWGVGKGSRGGNLGLL